MQRAAVWNTVQFAANGAVFVLLGAQMPRILNGATAAVREAGHHQTWVLAVHVLAIAAAIAGLRFVWVWISLRFTLFRAAQRGEARSVPSLRLAAAVSFAGVRGAVTLAGVLTFPLAMPDGTPFPARELCILLAAGVIVLTLVWASVSLPRLLSGLRLPTDHSQEDKRIAFASRPPKPRCAPCNARRSACPRPAKTRISSRMRPATCWRPIETGLRGAAARPSAPARAGAWRRRSGGCGWLA
jgi:NhaP-type Na+/H+ or K+/H+ antiporter